MFQAQKNLVGGKWVSDEPMGLLPLCVRMSFTKNVLIDTGADQDIFKIVGSLEMLVSGFSQTGFSVWAKNQIRENKITWLNVSAVWQKMKLGS